MLGAVQDVAIDHHPEAAAVDRVERGLQHPLDLPLGASAIGDQVGDGSDLDAVQLGEGDQVRQPGHGAVVLHDLADHAGGVEPGQPRDVDSGLGVAGADQNAPVLGHQREDVSGRDDVLDALGRVDGDGDGVSAVMGGDAGGDPFARLDRHREGGAVARLVVAGHRRQPQLARPLGGDRQADQSAGVLGHEIDLFGRRELRRDDYVALVLTILGVHQDVGPPVAGVLDDVLDGADRRGQVIVQRRAVGAERLGGRDQVGTLHWPAPVECARRIWANSTT